MTFLEKQPSSYRFLQDGTTWQMASHRLRDARWHIQKDQQLLVFLSRVWVYLSMLINCTLNTKTLLGGITPGMPWAP